MGEKTCDRITEPPPQKFKTLVPITEPLARSFGGRVSRDNFRGWILVKPDLRAMQTAGENSEGLILPHQLLRKFTRRKFSEFFSQHIQFIP